MSSIESHIAGSQKLTAIFGQRTSFRAAKAIELPFWCEQMEQGERNVRRQRTPAEFDSL